MTVAEEVIGFAERIGRPMTPWQRKLTAAVFSGERPAYLTAAMSRGRIAHMRTLTEFAAADGEHVHLAGRDGQWCVTLQPAGFLYVRIPGSTRRRTSAPAGA